MNTDDRNHEPSVATDQQEHVITEIDFNLEGFEQWLEEELEALMNRHAHFSTAQSNVNFFKR